MKSDEFFRRQLYQLRDELKENEAPSSQRISGKSRVLSHLASLIHFD